MDDLDDRVRAAMKALDERAAEHLSLEAKVLARLAAGAGGDGSDMNDVTTSTSGTGDASDGAPPRLEDSGLHDIKALAKTTRQRVSRRITSQHDIDEQLLTSSQSGLRAVALPEPAKLVALPSVAELAEKLETSEPAVARAAHKVAARSGQPRRAPIAWIAGGVAAAAAIVIGVVVIKGSGGDGKMAKQSAAAAADKDVATAGAAPTGPRQEARAASASFAMGGGAASGSAAASGSGSGSASGSAVAQGMAATPSAGSNAIGAAGSEAGSGSAAAEGSGSGGGSASGVEVPAVTDGAPGREKGHGPVVVKGDLGHGRVKDQPAHADNAGSGAKVDGGKDVHKVAPGAGSGAGTKKPGNGSKSLDDLIDEAAGGPDGATKKPTGGNATPTIEKKELTSQDIRTAMGSVTKRAQACYDKFNQAGTVGVKASVAPSGKITKVTITGAFAGTPTGDCVASVVEGVSFPAWDGAPMTVNYSYLLSE
jgi:hypothetical protein